MTDAERNLGPLTELMQGWWNEWHADCHPTVLDSLGRPCENLSWLYTQEELPVICGLSCGWRDGQTRDQLVASLRPRLKASAVEAAGLLEQPDARIAEQVAGALVPQPLGDELTFVTDLIEAAGAQTVQRRDRALVGAGIAGLMLLMFFLFRE
jgi:hypothetical protein